MFHISLSVLWLNGFVIELIMAEKRKKVVIMITPKLEMISKTENGASSKHVFGIQYWGSNSARYFKTKKTNW